MKWTRIAGAAIAAWLLAGTAAAGTIEGSVTLTPADLAFRGEARPNAYVGQLEGSAGNSGSVVVSDTTYGVAYVSDLPPPAEPPPPALLDQRDQRFVPRILAIVSGQSVVFRNSDRVFHNVFSYSPPKRFDLGRYARGKSKTLSFRKPGLVQIYCDIHSDMRADLVVVPSVYFAYVNAGGVFRIDDVPAGAHTVTIWLPKRGERALGATVPERGTVAVALGAE